MKQKKQITLEELLAQHPHLDPDLVKKIIDAVRRGRAGRSGRSYGLGTPLTRKKVTVVDSMDRRTVVLRKPA